VFQGVGPIYAQPHPRLKHSIGGSVAEGENLMEQTLVSQLMAVYDHLDAKRQRLKKEHDEIGNTLAGLRREIAVLRHNQPQLFPASSIPERAVYQNISIRWAVLWFLSESVGPVQTPAIADALRNGGVAERPNFNSIVSAILSQMAQKGEVIRAESGWQLTDTGYAVWESVKRSEKFLNRHTSPQLGEAESA